MKKSVIIRNLLLVCMAAVSLFVYQNVAASQSEQQTYPFRISLDNDSSMSRNFEYCIFPLNNNPEFGDTNQVDAGARWEITEQLPTGRYRLEVYAEGGAAYYEAEFSTSSVNTVHVWYRNYDNGLGGFKVTFYQ